MKAGTRKTREMAQFGDFSSLCATYGLHLEIAIFLSVRVYSISAVIIG